jgi:hypothetical protein
MQHRPTNNPSALVLTKSAANKALGIRYYIYTTVIRYYERAIARILQ